MNKVYLVTAYHGDFYTYSWELKSVCSSLQIAEK